MKIAIDRLLSDRLRLELPHEGSAPDSLDLERGVGVRGTYAHDADTIALEGLTAEALVTAAVLWHLGEASHVEASRLALSDTAIDLRIARGALHGRRRVVGDLATSDLRGEAIALSLGTTRVTATIIEGATVAVTLGKAERSEARIARVALTGVSIATPSLRVEIEAAEITGVVLGFGAGLDLSVGAFSLRGVEIVTSAAKLRLGNVRADGATFVRGALSLPELAVDEITFDVALATPSAPTPTPTPAPRTQPIDLGFLDGLSGQVDVDLHLDARIPVIKRRTAVHRFRVPIDGGTIDFHELERDLAGLEDAVLDFKLKGDRLVFQKDIPLIPFDEETIVYWSLDDDEIPLAKRNRVRLRRLADVKQPEPTKKKKEGEPSSFQILKLDLAPIDAVLRLGGGARVEGAAFALRLGDGERGAIGELRITGAVRHRPAEAPQAGEIRADARAIALGIERLAIASSVAVVERLEIAAVVDAHVTFEGVRPTGVRGTLRGARTRGVRLAYT